MALNDLVGTNIHNQEFIDPGVGQFNPPPQGGLGIHNQEFIDPGYGQFIDHGQFMGNADLPPNLQRVPLQPGELPMGQHPLMGMPPAVTDANIGNIKNPGLRIPGMPPPDYSSQFENFGKQLGGFGEQLTGYQDALGGFNEQIGGMGKQFETISNRLDSVDKGLGSLGNQIASLENMQKAQPQQVMQPQRPMFNPFSSPFGFGGLGSLFGRRY